MRAYLDHSATTPIDTRVIDAMLPFLREQFGNASSIHQFGQEARAAVDKARRQVGLLINARAHEIVFTSGGTEANNLAIRGICDAAQTHGRHIITSAIEHPSVRGVGDHLEKHGWSITRLPVYEEGIVRIDDVRAAMRDETVLVSIMTANNEIGTIQPVNEIGAFVRSQRENGHRYIWFHTDGVQAAGRMPLDVESIGCDLMTLSAHKMYAPKGAGALFIRRGVRLLPQQIGGHQERERRAGTESVANIVAFGAAAELSRLELDERNEHTRRLRDQFETDVAARIDDVVFNGDRDRRLPHLSNISFRFVEGEGLLIHLDMHGVAVSTGSACSSGTLEPSPVIKALGRNEELARGAIRFSFGKDNADEEVAYAVEALQRAVESLRALSPLGKDQSTSDAKSVPPAVAGG
ncbi:MAG TPA: cysteine desulfurase family protein [Pyrinomonadaceae bacterium]|nr:cysteine desulfurase family protein [Pyrinomonadaceae bacterium]